AFPVFSPDGKVLAVRSGENQVTLWDVATRRPSAVFNSQLAVLAISQDGKTLVTISTNYAIGICDVPTQTVKATIPFSRPNDLITRATLSPNGKILATRGKDGRVTLWEARSGIFIGTIEGHSG